MSILQLEGLPEEYKGYEISSDFRNMINVEIILNDTTMDQTKRLGLALTNLYPEVPEDLNVAIDGLLWFYNRGKLESSESKSDRRPTKKGYDFEQDADYIYSSFCTAYQIRLTELSYMHWWEFLALFQGLPDDTMMKKIIYWRTCEIGKLSKYEKEYVRKMREIFSLNRPEMEKIPMEELNKKTQEYYNARTKKGGS